ncbi:MAG: AIR synthase-related protein [Promethearchaeota archaeon]
MNEKSGDNAGKLSITDMKRFIFGYLGANNENVLIGPAIGKDYNVIRLEKDQVLIITTDPLYVNPVFGIKDATWFGFQILLADMLVSGVNPRHAIFSLNLPNDIEKDDLKEIWGVLHAECERLGVAIVSGHTGSYDGCDFPILGSGTLIANAAWNQVLKSDSVQDGDDIILATGPAIETIASLLKLDDDISSKIFEDDLARLRKAYWSKLSIEREVKVVMQAQDQLKQEGIENPIKLMHDVAEKGVLGAINELCDSTSFGCSIFLDKWRFKDGIKDYLLNFFSEGEIWLASGQGGLIIISDHSCSEDIVEELSSNDVNAAVIGHFTRKTNTREYYLSGKKYMISNKILDPFWTVFKKLVNNIKNNGR